LNPRKSKNGPLAQREEHLTFNHVLYNRLLRCIPQELSKAVILGKSCFGSFWGYAINIRATYIAPFYNNRLAKPILDTGFGWLKLQQKGALV